MNLIAAPDSVHIVASADIIGEFKYPEINARLAIMLGMQDIIDRLTEAKKRIQALLERL
jgi:hypothetical protein